jgi:class 3 adenylate cyclase
LHSPDQPAALPIHELGDEYANVLAEPMPADTGYIGMDVHRANRVISAGHGGQIVLSQSTCDLLDEAFELRDLNLQRLLRR